MNHEATAKRYDVIAPVLWEGRQEPLWIFLGTAETIAREPGGEPARIRVKLDVLSHQGDVLRFGPNEGAFELALRSVDVEPVTPAAAGRGTRGGQ